MTNDEHDNLQPEQDPLTESIHSYVKKGRMKAKKRGWMWFTTRAAVDAYLLSRHLDNIPKKYRKSD